MASKDDPGRLGADATAGPVDVGSMAALGAAPARRVADTAAYVLHTQAWFIGASLASLAAAFVAARMLGQSLRFGMYGNVQLAFFLNLAVICVVLRIGWTLVRQRPARPLGPVWHDLLGGFAIGRRIVVAVPALVLLPLTLSAYTSMKTMIPLAAPFAWDARLAVLDSRLHGGLAPWELLQPVLGMPSVTHWIDWAYGPLWFWLLMVLQFWQTFSLHPQRTRFLVTFVLSWALLGTGTAMIFASAGPAYYATFVAGPDPYAPLLAYLDGVAESTPVLALQAQADLWRNFMAGEVSLAAGISAMPSMHLSMGMLLVLTTWRLGPLARGLSCTYLVVLLAGSVHLAWHYAIDGYAAIAGTWAIWWAVGRALDRRSPAVRNIARPTTAPKRF